MLLAVTEALGATWGLPRFLLAMALLAFGLFCCYVKYIHIKYDYIPGPPRASFFLGHIPILWRILKKNEIFHEYFLQCYLEQVCGEVPYTFRKYITNGARSAQLKR